jgi:predicted small secreted protein
MKKKMKKILLLMIVAIATSVFTACDKGDDGGGSSVSTDGSISGKLKLVEASWNEDYTDVSYILKGDVTDEIDEIWAVMESGDNEIVLGKYPVSNGEFSFKIPVPDDNYLYSIYDEDMPSGLTISDPTVKAGYVDFEAYKNGQYVCSIERITSDLSDDVGIEYMYTSKDVKITGTFVENDEGETYNNEYNVSFKKGWNTIVSKTTEKENAHTNKFTANDEPSGMIWVAEKWNNKKSTKFFKR